LVEAGFDKKEFDLMGKMSEVWENEGGASHPAERKSTSHMTLLTGVLYAATVIAVLVFVSRL
jgi:hypothetical protein